MLFAVGNTVPLQFEPTPTRIQDRSHVAVSDAEIVQLIAAHRNFGFWQFDLETGHLFASEDVYRIFDMAFSTGPMNLVETMSRVHEDDRPRIMENYEQSSRHKIGFNHTYRVSNGHGGYKTVRAVAQFRDSAGGGDIVGVTYELFEQRQPTGYPGKDS